MTITINAYFSFRKNARQAMEFYQSVFGGELTVGTFKEFGAAQNPDEEALVMHSQLTAPNLITLMASDVPDRENVVFGDNVSLSLSGDDGDTLRRWFDQLAVGGHVEQPLIEASWGDTFGMCVDQFGIRWLFNISPKIEK